MADHSPIDEGDNKVVQFPGPTVGEIQVDQPRPPLDNTKPADQDSGMNDRLAKLEGSYDALKVVRPMTTAVVGIFLAALTLVLSFLSVQIISLNSRFDGLSAKVDAIPIRLTEEFRAQRAETAAQTSAIANSITATRQAQPQVIVVPLPPQQEQGKQP